MRGLTYGDGFFPFCPSAVDKYGDPYEEWDGSTTYTQSSVFPFPRYSKKPSKSASEYIPVYGDGSLFPLGLTLEQASEFYWRWKSFAIRVAGGFMPALTVEEVSVETFSPDFTLGSPNYTSTTETGASVTLGRDVSTFPDPVVFTRGKYFSSPDWLDNKEQSLVCSPRAWTYPAVSGWSPPELNANDPLTTGRVTASSQITLMESLQPGAPPSFPLLPTPFKSAPTFLFAANKYWLFWDVGFSFSIFAARNESRNEPETPWPNLVAIDQRTSKYLIHVSAIRVQSAAFTGSTIKRVPVQIVMQDGTIVSGNVYSNSVYSEDNGADGSSPIAGLTADFIPPTQSLRPVKYWTYGGIYDEDTGERV